ncbi:hypothetical protein JZ751_008772 [Albula glossodonta]|uniref:Uncharacterized protein n=1 Tax=Albula glossodonta TaxID=121402 RepID=A0A8T2P7W1_9TELE|nr:hypothetical protein JZ751_008772 [Albula glossodonta]
MRGASNCRNKEEPRHPPRHHNHLNRGTLCPAAAQRRHASARQESQPHHSTGKVIRALSIITNHILT